MCWPYGDLNPQNNRILKPKTTEFFEDRLQTYPPLQMKTSGKY
jgi:hypothetical protein